MERWGENKDHDEVINDKGEGENRTEATFGFPIFDTMQDLTMKNIPPSTLPTFYGKSNEDPDTFLFEFDCDTKASGFHHDPILPFSNETRKYCLCKLLIDNLTGTQLL